jgi:polyferredoxin
MIVHVLYHYTTNGDQRESSNGSHCPSVEEERKMKKKVTPAFIVRTIINIAALGLFVFLAIQQQIQLWFVIFLAGVVISFLLGRWYCGWVCPMYVLFRPINWLYEKLGIKRFAKPSFLTRPLIRYIIVAVFLGFLVFQRMRGMQVPVLLFITGIAVIITLFFEEELWHAHLCPFGTILSLTSRTAPLKMNIDSTQCTHCGVCTAVCPTDAVQLVETTEEIDKHRCLTCFDCKRACPQGAITYGKG